MIEAMAEVFKQHGNRWHIADFFTRVSKFLVNMCSIHSEANALDENVFLRRLTFSRENMRHTGKLLENNGLVVSFEAALLRRPG